MQSQNNQEPLQEFVSTECITSLAEKLLIAKGAAGDATETTYDM
jgi:hypothetical protein